MRVLRRFRTELLLVFLGLFVTVQATGYLATRAVSERSARTQVAESLAVAGGALVRLLGDRERHLLEAGRLLGADFAFKAAFATGDHGTILSLIDNHGRRIGADAMVLLSLDEAVVAATLDDVPPGMPFDHPWLIDRALDDPGGEAAGILMIDDAPLQFIVLPLLAPLHEGWIAIGFSLDDAFAASLKAFAMADLTLVSFGDATRIHASTLDAVGRGRLLHALPAAVPDEPFELATTGRTDLTLALPLAAEGAPLFALMQRPLDEVLAPYRELQAMLALLLGLGVLATAAGAALLARGVTRPLTALARGAHAIAAGDYTQRVAFDRRDEIGQLGDAFNDMAVGLADRDRVRNLLGKVVSPQIAEELLKRDIALGGEERVASVLFADCRGFTALSENLPPALVLERLNEMLTVLTDVIERYGGVVDKYIGDAVMALFGAPLAHDDDAVRAVRCALDMLDAMDRLNATRPVGQRLELGIGVSTGRLVAGNMGSATRLNYTVIGDTVNLASRVEGLTRRYEARVLVTQATRDACGDAIAFREIDRVQVKGRAEPVTIFEPF